MFGRKHGATAAASDALDGISPYVDQLAHDEKLRKRLMAAVVATAAARTRARQQAGLVGMAGRLASDPVLRAQVAEAVLQLQKARLRLRKKQSHRTRNWLLLLTGAGLIVAAVPSLRGSLMKRLRGGKDDWAPQTWSEGQSGTGSATIEHEIEVDVPLSTAYNQWTQFEEFPRFMEGVESVEQLDDSLLHWAATVAGKRAEWDAKIVEQVPDRRIAWESVDGKRTRGTVTFEPAGSTARTRVRLEMSYKPEGVGEKVGSAVGLDQRRVRSDLERFRELIEAQQVESGAWRGEIKDGQPANGGGGELGGTSI
jgi:uncharacterized membrane protein